MIIYAIQFEDERGYETHITILEPVFLNKELAEQEMKSLINEYHQDSIGKWNLDHNRINFSIRELPVKE